jgi:hypothetical protein
LQLADVARPGVGQQAGAHLGENPSAGRASSWQACPSSMSAMGSTSALRSRSGGTVSVMLAMR